MERCYFDTGTGERVCDGDTQTIPVETIQFFEQILFWFFIVGLAVTLIVLVALYCYGVATRTGRSRIGFVWLSIFFPAAALGICLVLDKDNERYTEEERNKYRLKR